MHGEPSPLNSSRPDSRPFPKRGDMRGSRRADERSSRRVSPRASRRAGTWARREGVRRRRLPAASSVQSVEHGIPAEGRRTRQRNAAVRKSRRPLHRLADGSATATRPEHADPSSVIGCMKDWPQRGKVLGDMRIAIGPTESCRLDGPSAEGFRYRGSA